MDEFQAFYAAFRALWHSWFPSAIARGCANAALFFCVFFVVVWVIETLYGTRSRNYRSREFAYDAFYYFYYRTGLHRFLFTATVVTALVAPLSALDLGLLRPLPMAVQVILGLLVADFFMYWLHRAQHTYRFLWAFHTTHHAPTRLTYATFLRFHPVEVMIGDTASYALLAILGADFTGWVAIFMITTFLGEVQHTQIPWTMGPLRWIFVTPRFHAFHHSIERAEHDRNFGGLFSFWDRMFGTAMPDDAPAPKTYGLPDVKPDSLVGTFVSPFQVLRRLYRPGQVAGAETVAQQSSPP